MQKLILSESTFLDVFRLARNVANIDENSHIIVCSSHADVCSQSWFLLTVNLHKFYRPVHFICNLMSDTLVFTHTNLFNLNEGSSFLTKHNTNEDIIVLDKFAKFVPKYANSIALAAVEPCEVGTYIIDKCLRNYFQIPRYVCHKDLICLNMREYVPDVFFTNSKIPSKLYFKVDAIDGPVYDITDATCGYFVNCEYTTVNQIRSTQCYRPCISLDCSVQASIDEIQAYLYPVIPDGLTDTALKIEEMILPFLSLNADSKSFFIASSLLSIRYVYVNNFFLFVHN